MGVLDRWVKTSSPLVKLLMAISITSGLVVLNKLFYAPHVKRNKALRAEEWANVIIAQEEAMEEQTDSRF